MFWALDEHREFSSALQGTGRSIHRSFIFGPNSTGSPTLCNPNYTRDNNLTTPTTKPLLPCKPRGFGSPTGRHSGRTKVSKSSGAGLLLLLTSSAPSTRGQAGWGNNSTGRACKCRYACRTQMLITGFVELRLLAALVCHVRFQH